MKQESLISKILRSVFFKKAQGEAGRFASNSNNLMDLAKQVLRKLRSGGFKGNMAEFSGNVQLLLRMVKAYASGNYKVLPWKSLVSIVAVLIYFVSPIDLIPDFLPVIGITDDIALVVWLMKTIGEDIDKFSEWEKNEKTINIG